MDCLKCGKALPNDSKFCQYCGALQEALPEVAKKPEDNKTEVRKDITSLIQRGFLSLEESKWKQANTFFEQALNNDVECAEAYLGKMMAQMHIRTRKDLLTTKYSLKNDINYQRAVRFAKSPLREELEELPKARLYTLATVALKNGDPYEATTIFKKVQNYKDAEIMLEHCRIEQEKCKQKAKKTGWIVFTVIATLLIIVAAILCVVFWAIPEKKYTAALELVEAGRYEEAIIAFSEIKDYKDSLERKDKTEIKMIEHADVGDVLTFGTYEEYFQKEDIEWVVLDKKDDKVLVISKTPVFYESFGSTTLDGLEAITQYRKNNYLDLNFVLYDVDKNKTGFWEDSCIRYDMHKSIDFNSLLYDRITETYNYNKGDQNTADYLFLLSVDETKKYLSTQATRSIGDEWFLRSTIKDNDVTFFAYVDEHGNICDSTSYSKMNEMDRWKSKNGTKGVRPAMWISTKNVG